MVGTYQDLLVPSPDWDVQTLTPELMMDPMQGSSMLVRLVPVKDRGSADGCELTAGVG